MKNNYVILLTLAMTVLFLQCGSDKGNNPKPLSVAEKDMVSEWCFNYSWSTDSTFKISIRLDSTRSYETRMVMNGNDTVYSESGAWSFLTEDSINKIYSIEIDVAQCQFQATPGNCAGVLRKISVSGVQNKWLIPLNTLMNNIPAGIVPKILEHSSAFFYRNDCLMQIPEKDAKITGVWRWSLPYNPDTTFYIVMYYDSNYTYSINVNINHVDTMHKEMGTWHIISDTALNVDTVWMNRMVCHQINLTTHTFDLIDCGLPVAGIKIDITTIQSRIRWVILLNDFVKYMPPGVIPDGLDLPPGAFYKD